LMKYKDGNVPVELKMGKDYSVTSVHVISPEYDSVMTPRFMASGKGFLMTRYDATYEGPGGKDKTDVHATIEYQDVVGLKLPKRVELSGSYNGGTFDSIVAFESCTASK
jgi:hypothetical protein